MTRRRRCKGCRTLTERTCCRCGQAACWRCATKHLWPDGVSCLRRRRFGVVRSTSYEAVARPDLWPLDRVARFRAFIPAQAQPDDSCSPWSGSRALTGHGIYDFRQDGHALRVLAHRTVYILENGPLPKDHNVFHRCHERACCNPAHLVAAPMRLRPKAQGFRSPAGGEHYHAKLTAAKVAEIRRLADSTRARALAKRFGLSISHLHAIIRGSVWRWTSESSSRPSSPRRPPASRAT
jgi:hypothetical protein